MVSDQNDAKLDLNVVKRGDAEMSQKLYCVVRACIEMGEKNPTISIHDQGAGGNCNVIKEIIYPQGAEIDIRAVVVGDHTMSVLEIWGAEYQEQDVILVKAEIRELLQSVVKRERLSMAVIGTINGECRCTLIDSTAAAKCSKEGLPPPPPAVDLEFEKVLGDMPKKTFEFNCIGYALEPLDIAPGITLMDSLKRVLRLPSVSSKRFLTTKVDRCVTGLVAQQQTRLCYLASFAKQGALTAMGTFVAEKYVVYCLPLVTTHLSDDDCELAYVLLKEFKISLTPMAVQRLFLPTIGYSHLTVSLLQDSFVWKLEGM